MCCILDEKQLIKSTLRVVRRSKEGFFINREAVTEVGVNKINMVKEINDK